MSTLQIAAPVAAQTATAAPRHPGLVLRIVRAVIAAMAEANRQKAEREVARVAHRYGIGRP